MTEQERARELHRIVTTTAIYRKDGDSLKFLVIQRSMSEKVHPGKWSLIGGGLTTDDYANRPKDHGGNAWRNVVEISLEREKKEESGVIIGTPRYLHNFAFIRPDNIPVFVMVYYAPYISGEVKLDKKTQGYRWVTLAEAGKLNIIDGIYSELEEISKIIKGEA